MGEKKTTELSFFRIICVYRVLICPILLKTGFNK